MSQTQAKVIEHSVCSTGIELVTQQVRYPRLVHSELMTHRVFSRNASSSRAIPVAKMIEQVRTDPAMPVHWGQNQPGMQAREEIQHVDQAKALWVQAANSAADYAELMMNMGLHKQVANRILEPFQFIHVIITSTEWDNFYELRDHEDADPNIRALAQAMFNAKKQSKATYRAADKTSTVNWHLPYITQEERATHASDPITLARWSAARCARVSYLTHDGKAPDPQKDLALYEALVGSRPLHASPVEHQAYPDQIRSPLSNSKLWGNFNGWVQHRKVVEMGL